ncbi:hypothetical protein ACFUOZ_21305, partial [Paenarthrobacter sp. NPDC057355]|uniref:hypothetical protein n=1 Tax=Paenarthrobacter sp. NPDC057355 TaxID=3346105 RepID=UPI00362E39BA
SESVFFESLSVEDLQVLAGSSVTGSAEMVRGGFSVVPEHAGGSSSGGRGVGEGLGGVGTPVLNEVLRSKGFAELNARGEGPRVGGSAGLPVNEVLAVVLIVQAFSEDSTVLNQAAALLATVPVVGQIFWFASAVEGRDETNIVASGLALASAGIEAGIGLAGLFGVEAGAVIAGLSALASTLGLVSLAVVGVSIFVSLVKTKGWGWIAEHSSPLAWFISSLIDKQPGHETGPAQVPALEWTHNDPHGEWGGIQNGHYQWTNEYVKARMTNAYLIWADEYAKNHVHKLAEAMERKFALAQKTVIYNSLLAQGAAERVGVMNADTPAEIETAKATIRTKAGESLAALKEGMIKAVKDNHAIMIESMNKGAGFNEFKNTYLAETLIPEYIENTSSVCATVRRNQDALIHDGGYERNKIWDELIQTYSTYGQCTQNYWTPELFTRKFHAPTQALTPYTPDQGTVNERITATINGTGHAPADLAVKKLKENADKASEFTHVNHTKAEAEESAKRHLTYVQEAGRALEKTVALLPAAVVSSTEVKNTYATLKAWKEKFQSYDGLSTDGINAAKMDAAAAIDALVTLASQSPAPAFALAHIPASTTINTTNLAWTIETPLSSTPTKNTTTSTSDATGAGALINGFGPAGHHVAVKYTTGPSNGATICTATVTDLGIWACKTSTALHPGAQINLHHNDQPINGTTINLPGIKPTINPAPFQNPINPRRLANSAYEWSGQGTPGHTLTGTVSCGAPGQIGRQFRLRPITVDTHGTWSYPPRASNMLKNSRCLLTITDTHTQETTTQPFTTTGRQT